MFKVNNKDTRALTLNVFHTLFINFEHVIASWVTCPLSEKLLCKESNEELVIISNYLNITRNNSKSIKLPSVKLELAKQSFYFSGGV